MCGLLFPDRLSQGPRRSGECHAWAFDDFRLSWSWRSDVRLDHHIHRTACHDQVLDIIPADQDEPPPAIDVGLIDNIKTLFRLRAE